MIFPSLGHIGGNEDKQLVAQWAQGKHALRNHNSRHRSLGSPAVTPRQSRT